MPNLGPTELIIILLIVVLLFGARKIPEIAKGLGKGIKDFKGAMKDDDEKDKAEAAKIESKKSDDAPKSST